MKFQSLNLLEPSGPVQACTGIAFFLLKELNEKLLRMPPPKDLALCSCGRENAKCYVVRA